MKLEKAFLVLADGTVFEGKAFGANGARVGEAVFTTTMSGYQEVVTDPSFAGQVVTLTAPEIGNVGTNLADSETIGETLHLSGLVIRSLSPIQSNWRSEATLPAYLERNGIAGITEIDTRALTKHLRDHGSQNCAIGTDSPDALRKLAQEAVDMNGLDLVKRVTPKEPYAFTEGSPTEFRPFAPRKAAGAHVVAIDYGMKRNILRSLVDRECKVTVVPATFTAEQISKLNPDGVFLSNGPGDPAATTYAIETVKGLLGKHPIFGICLGHQLLALALGAKTYKLKFGHRGANQPVKDLETGKIEITSQNHGFCVDVASLPKHANTTHVHLNDGTSEGLAAPELRAFSVQYHPEAAAGPHDSLHLFDRFAAAISA